MATRKYANRGTSARNGGGNPVPSNTKKLKGDVVMVTTSSIYVIENTINNKKYVGQSTNITERWYRHSVDYKRLTDRYLYRAMNKHGFDNFIFEVIETNIPIDSIGDRERYWIETLETFAPNGYNMTIGGEGTFNRIITTETRQKISESLKGGEASEETKRNMSFRNIKRYEDVDERVKMSESHKSNSKLIDGATKRIISYNESLTKDEKEIVDVKRADSVRNKLGKKVEGVNMLDGSTVNFDSGRQAAKWIRENTGYEKACHTNISKTCRGKLDFVYNYKWRYI